MLCHSNLYLQITKLLYHERSYELISRNWRFYKPRFSSGVPNVFVARTQSWTKDEQRRGIMDVAEEEDGAASLDQAVNQCLQSSHNFCEAAGAFSTVSADISYEAGLAWPLFLSARTPRNMALSRLARVRTSCILT